MAAKNDNYLAVLAYLICLGGRIDGVDYEENGIICHIRPKDIAVVQWLASLSFSDPIRHDIAGWFVRYPDDDFLQYLGSLVYGYSASISVG